MNRRSGIHTLVLTAAILASGCATGGATGNPFASPSENPANEVRLMAQNQSDQDVRISALNGAKTRVLGIVRARSIDSYRVPIGNSSSMRIRLEPLTGIQHTTNSVLVRPGDTLDLYIAPDPSNSFLRVR